MKSTSDVKVVALMNIDTIGDPDRDTISVHMELRKPNPNVCYWCFPSAPAIPLF